MDGGLVVQFSGTSYRRSENSLIVHSPIENRVEFLPAAPDFETCDGYPELFFLVDPISQSFKAFLINHDHRKTAWLSDPSTSAQERAWIRNDPLVRVYDSVSREWDSLVNPDWDTTVIHPLCSSVMLQSRLFLLFGARRYAFQDYVLWVYNLVEKNWLNLAMVDIPDFFYNPKLVMTDDRLFLATWSVVDPPDLSGRSSFEVQEIDMVQMVRKRPVLKLSHVDVKLRFGIQSALETYPEMVVIGIQNARLMVMAKSSGKCGVFDVVRNCWEEMQENPLGQMPEEEERFWAGKNMKLLLPNAPW